MKAIPLLPTTLIKTTFIFIAYKVIYALLDILGHIPLLKNFGKMIEIQGMHSISPSPELQDFLIGNIDKLEHINTQINIIRKLERLHVIQQDLDTKAYEIHSDGYFHRNIPEEIELQRTLLEAEKKSLQEELEQEKLEQEIILLKRRFLSLLDAL